MSRRMIPPLRGRIDDCSDPTVMKQSTINQLDVGEESIDELLGSGWRIDFKITFLEHPIACTEVGE
jgi:hypothetical protein